jgi:hypothetical protein
MDISPKEITSKIKELPVDSQKKVFDFIENTIKSNKKTWDVFISHASEDKESFVHPLVIALQNLGVSVWYDQFSLEPGDSLSESIDKGLSESRFGLVIISHHFMAKQWTKRELRGLVAREIYDEDKVIIPVWLGVDYGDVICFSPPLADKIAIQANGNVNIEAIAIQTLRVVCPDIYRTHPSAKLHSIASGQSSVELQRELEQVHEKLEETKERLSEFQCPTCGAPVLNKIEAPFDDEHKHWGEREIFACGYTRFGSQIETLCSSDPNFPAFEDYELRFVSNSDEPFSKWTCIPHPKTDMAKLRSLSYATGRTKEEAQQSLFAMYNKCASKY